MAAATQERRTRIYHNGRPPIRMGTLKAGEKVYRGTMAMHVAGVVETAKTGVAGSVLLGIAQDTYDASDKDTNYTFLDGMTFSRDPFKMDSVLGADQLTTAQTGVEVAVKNDQELTKTIGTNDLTVRAIERETELSWICEIP